MRDPSAACESSLSRRQPAAAREIRDFLNASSGSAAGHLAYVLFEDPSVAELPPGEPLPTNWLARGERLLTLPDDHGRFSLLSFARNLGWLHNHAAAWSEEHVVAVLLRHGASRDAALAGFFLNPTVWDAQLYRQLKPLLIEIGVAVHQSHLRDIHALGTFFVRGWLTRDHDGARWLTDEEFRRILLYGGDDLRGHILWHTQHFEDFTEKLALLRDVWPLQLAARTPLVTGRLCALAFEDEAHFRELVAAILPLVSNDPGRRMAIPILPDKTEAISLRHPEEVLALLSAVLPDEASLWPYGADKMLSQLLQAKPELAADPRFAELKDVWERR
jgi:hypothetical protein